VRAPPLYCLAKVLEGLGMLILLVGVILSIELGMQEEGLESMRYEGNALLVGGGLFLVGYLIERALGSR
jgi:hypothetical protein